MTNVNPGNRDPRKGRFGGSRKFFSRDKSDDLLQDRDDLVDDLGQDPAPEHYEAAGDGSFGEALDEYYDPRADRDHVQRETAPRGKHHRREDDDDHSGYAAAAVSGAGHTDGDYAEHAEPAYGDYVDAEYEPEYASEPAEYRDHEDYADNKDYDGDRAATAAAPGGAAAGGSSTASAAGGVPKRGLAMILIAVALLLALWGVYAMTRGDYDNQAANEPASQSAQDPNNPTAQGQNPSDPNAQGQNGQPGANGQNPNDPNNLDAQGQQGEGQGQDRQPGQGNGAAPAGANNPMTSENQTINVYNNSAITGFADQVAGQVEAKGTTVGEVGNIPGEVVTFGQNTVLFDPATPDAERFARELADKVGGVAVPIDDRIPAEARKPGALTLVLAENRPVNI